MHVLITRPKDESINLEIKLKDYGFKVHKLPIIEITTIFENKTQIEEELSKKIRFAIITSPSGAKALVKLTNLRDFEILTIGDKTGSILKENGFLNVKIIKKTAENLAKHIVENFTPNDKKIIYFSGSNISFDIIKYLELHKFNASEIIIYNSEKLLNIDLKFSLIAKQLDAALFFSARTAQIFVDEVITNGIESELVNCTAVCLSNNIAKTLNKIKWKNIITSNQVTEDSLLNKVLEIWKIKQN